jgi:lysophospholipase L1-like esterase
MAPAACDTICQHLKDFGRNPMDYDAIITGDLGSVGQTILLQMAESRGIDLSKNLLDCGMMIFDPESLPAHDDYAPDYVFIEYGSNDLGKVADNKTALSSAKAWLVKMRGLYPEAQKICILPDFTPCGREESQIRQDSYCAELKRICADFGIPAFSSAPLIPNLDVMFCADHVHFSEAGSAVFANRLLNAVRLSRS